MFYIVLERIMGGCVLWGDCRCFSSESRSGLNLAGIGYQFLRIWAILTHIKYHKAVKRLIVLCFSPDSNTKLDIFLGTSTRNKLFNFNIHEIESKDNLYRFV